MVAKSSEDRGTTLVELTIARVKVPQEYTRGKLARVLERRGSLRFTVDKARDTDERADALSSERDSP